MALPGYNIATMKRQEAQWHECGVNVGPGILRPIALPRTQPKGIIGVTRLDGLPQ